MKTIPAPILTAATTLLGPYCPDLTATRLLEALSTSSAPCRPAPLPEAMTKRDVCQAAKVSLQSVNRWLSSGRLAHVKVGRSVRIPRSAVEALLQPADPGVEVV